MRKLNRSPRGGVLGLVVLYLTACSNAPNTSSSTNSGSLDSAQKPLVFDTRGTFKAFFDSDKKPELSFENAPSFVHALGMAPKNREPELNKGTWLVLAFSVLSQDDVRSIVSAVRGVKRCKAEVELGLRPFFRYDESNNWYKEYGNVESPLWIVLRDGRVLHEEKGKRSEDQVAELLVMALSRD